MSLNALMTSATQGSIATAPSPDSTDILPVTAKDRQNSLEKHLQLRPDMQDLKNRSILLDTSAAP